MSHDQRSRTTRRVVPLTREHLDELPEVAACVAWQLDAVRRARLPDEARREAKTAWLAEVEQAWGRAGHAVLFGGTPVAAIVHAPAAWLPGAAAHPTAPLSPDAVVVAGLWVDPRHRGGGLARLLVQSTAADLVRHHPAARDGSAPVALETFADTRGGRSCADGGPCLLPVELWEALGFVVRRSHPTTPRVRMDLRTTVGWRAVTGQALGRITQAVRRRPVPAPGARRTGRVLESVR